MLILWEQVNPKISGKWFKRERLIININDDKMELRYSKILRKVW